MMLNGIAQSMRASRRWVRSGFSLVEILIVLALLLVLGTLAVVGYGQIKAKADRDAARILVNQTAEAVKLYNTSMNRYPDMEEGLNALINPPEDLGGSLADEGQGESMAEKWAGPYLQEGQIPRDPWGNQLQYEPLEQDPTAASSGRPPFRVWSLGPDGQDGTEDDIASWSGENA